MSANGFLPENYEVPKGPSNYVKLESGDNKLRILSAPVLGYSYWNLQDKPVRVQGVVEPSVDKSLIKKDQYGNQPVRHFWAMVVYNYQAKQIQILEAYQSSIQGPLKALAENPDWGNPFAYDITINKSGTGKETEYKVVPIPPKPVSDEVKAAYKAKPANLQKLFTGEDPFASAGSTQAQPATPTPAAQTATETLMGTNADGLPF